MTFELSFKEEKTANLVQVILKAEEKGIISNQRAQECVQEINQLAFNLTLQLNRQGSTSLSIIEYQRIMDTINYFFMLAFKSYGCDVQSLKQTHIQAFFDTVLNLLKNKNKK